MKNFVFLFRSSPAGEREAMGTPERAQKSLESWKRWIQTLEASGHLADPGQPLAREGKRVSGSLVTDGPFVEAKDVVLGFIVVRARDLGHACELAGGCPIAQAGGAVEVRPVATLPEAR